MKKTMGRKQWKQSRENKNQKQKPKQKTKQRNGGKTMDSKKTQNSPHLLVKFDENMKFIIREPLIDLHQPITFCDRDDRVDLFVGKLTQVLNDGGISDMETLEDMMYYFSINLLEVYEEIPNEFIKWYNIKNFYMLRAKYMNSKVHVYLPSKDRIIYLSVAIEKFYMIYALAYCDLKVVNATSIRLEEIRRHHFQNVAA